MSRSSLILAIAIVLGYALPGVANAGGVVAGATRKQNTDTTPSGTYPMTQAFGVAANPGTAMPYLHAGSCDWWDEDQRSRFYNEHVDACTTRTDYALTTTGTYSSEHLVDYAGQYRYAVVVDFNRPDPVPGRGAGIFLHVNGTGATAGCVSVPLATMTTVIRWLSPGQHPRIAIA